MKRKFINALVFGAFLLAPASTFVSCSDYDDDIASLQDQIDQNADASNLSELVDLKLRNVDAEIESLNNVKEQLADALAATTDEAARQRIASAQALVDEAVTALTTARDKAEGLLDADKSLQTYLRADATLQEGIDRAQSCASRAYALAVQAEVDNVANNLNLIQQSLEGQIDVLQGNLDNLYDQVNNQETGILAQLAAIDQLVEDIQNGMLDKDDLAGLASQEDLENLRTDLEGQLPDIEQLKTELQGIMDQKIAAATENLASDQDVTNAVNAAITQLTTAYQTADQGLQSQITGLDGRVEKLEKDYSTLEGKVTEATGLVNAMSNDLNNLVTGIILQDNQLQFVYAKVASQYIGDFFGTTDSKYLTTDAQGRKVDCRNTVVILTSNIGAKKLTDTRPALGFTDKGPREQDAHKAVMEEVKHLFRPEFLNRLDEILIFHALTPDEIRQSADRLLDKLQNRLHDLGYEVHFAENVSRYVSEKGYDPVYGARPLRRVIQTVLEDPLSTAILEEQLCKEKLFLCSLTEEGHLQLQSAE